MNIYKDIADQFVAMMEVLKKRSTLGINDDKNAWLSSGFHREGGKVLFVEIGRAHV